MKLTTLSPVFIGGGEELNQGQYVFDSKTMMAKILDENKFATFLIKNNLIDSYSEVLLRDGGKINLKRWLEEKRIPQNVPIFSKVISCKNLANKNKRGKASLNSIKTFVKNSDNLAYIPGSSIKGAIRTAYCSYLVNKYKDKFQSEWQEIKHALTQRNNKSVTNKIIKKIEKKCFNLIKYEDEKADNGDIFSTLIISDSKSIPQNKLYITTRLDCAVHKDKPSSMPMNLELVEPNFDIYFNLTIDRSNGTYFSIEKMQEVLKFYAQQQIDNVIYDKCSKYLYSPDEILDDSDDLSPNICLGGMTGYFSKNIVYSLAPTKQDAVNVLRRYFAINFKMHKHLEYDNKIAPHTIKAVKDNGDIIPLGWCNLSVEKEIDVSDITN